MAFNSPHKLNSNSLIPAGSYGHSINLHPQQNTSVLVAVVSSSSATSVRSDQWNLIKLNLLTCISHLLIEVCWSGDPMYVCFLCNTLSPKFWSSVNTQDNGISMNLWKVEVREYIYNCPYHPFRGCCFIWFVDDPFGLCFIGPHSANRSSFNVNWLSAHSLQHVSITM